MSKPSVATSNQPVLVTGFGPFLSHSANPSASLAHMLDGATIDGVVFTSLAPLFVAYELAAAQAVERALALRPRAVIGLGMGSQHSMLHVERRARNQAREVQPDARGVSKSGALVPGGAEERLTQVDVESISAKLNESGHAARVSDDAGGYVCNDFYYRLLGALPHVPTVFIHVPSTADREVGLAPSIARAVLSTLASQPAPG